jgi:SEC-C motif-containing protein
MKTPSTTCPCGSGLAYPGCCGRYLDAGERPATAEQLMRSRYTAYSLGREHYLLDSWHPSTRPRLLDLAAEPAVQWVGMKILDAADGGARDTTGSVAFVARCKLNGRAQRLHEVSRFVREDGRWYYLDGDTGRAADKR